MPTLSTSRESLWQCDALTNLWLRESISNPRLLPTPAFPEGSGARRPARAGVTAENLQLRTQRVRLGASPGGWRCVLWRYVPEAAWEGAARAGLRAGRSGCAAAGQGNACCPWFDGGIAPLPTAPLRDSGAFPEPPHLARSPPNQSYVCPRGKAQVLRRIGAQQSHPNPAKCQGSAEVLSRSRRLPTYDRCKQLGSGASRRHESRPGHIFAKMQALQKKTSELLITTLRG